MEFVTFELAKKLKEKGFKEQCLAYYPKDTEFYYNASNYSDVESALKSFNSHPNLICGKRVDAPTISQVLKWLRDNKLLVIPIPSYFNAEGVCVSWDCDIWADDNYEHCHSDKKTYEEAALDGIEYVLDNLI